MLYMIIVKNDMRINEYKNSYILFNCMPKIGWIQVESVDVKSFK